MAVWKLVFFVVLTLLACTTMAGESEEPWYWTKLTSALRLVTDHEATQHTRHMDQSRLQLEQNRYKLEERKLIGHETRDDAAQQLQIDRAEQESTEAFGRSVTASLTALFEFLLARLGLASACLSSLVCTVAFGFPTAYRRVLRLWDWPVVVGLLRVYYGAWFVLLLEYVCSAQVVSGQLLVVMGLLPWVLTYSNVFLLAWLLPVAHHLRKRCLRIDADIAGPLVVAAGEAVVPVQRPVAVRAAPLAIAAAPMDMVVAANGPAARRTGAITDAKLAGLVAGEVAGVAVGYWSWTVGTAWWLAKTGTVGALKLGAIGSVNICLGALVATASTVVGVALVTTVAVQLLQKPPPHRAPA